MTVLDRFLSYIALDTTSREDSESCPSTPEQWALARLLEEEMRALGLSDVRLDQHAYVYGFIPGNDPALPAIGLIAHMDTSDAVPGGPVRPRVLHYTGGDVVLNAEQGIVMREKDFECLQADRDKDLIVTDGTTLLGGDDKAGVAEIMTFCEYVLAHPHIRHGRICVGFTPDEEIGRGADRFDVDAFGADFAYTVDGGAVNEIEYENFNAASALVRVQGFSIHPGSAKNKMRNAARMAMEFHGMLPAHETPECTEGYEGFYHLTDIRGEEQQASLHYIIRDHDREKFEGRKARMEKIAVYLNDKYGAGSFDLALRDSYYNMKEKVQEKPEVIERAFEAIRQCGLTPRAVPIRGGTDGARLSYMGLICPNLGTGGRNCHGIFEYAVVQEMETMVEILKKLVLAAD
ncbi:MAG: peptidase T [Clostridiales bacterium]|nr:peptidase T [Clostridiales bacterium]